MVQKIAFVLMKKTVTSMVFLKVFQVTSKKTKVHRYLSPSQYVFLLSVLKFKGFLF